MVSSASRPFSAKVTLCPCSCRPRARSRRLTLLSSTTSRRPGPGFPLRLMLVVLQRLYHLVKLGPQTLHLGLGPVEIARLAHHFELLGRSRKRHRPQAGPVRLERVSRPAETFGILSRQRGAQGVE